MTAFIDEVLAVLQGDADLATLLTGGIYGGTAEDEITRQDTPDAFDANGEILPCALLKQNTDIKLGPYSRSLQTTFSIYFYQRREYDVIDAAAARAFDLLQESMTGTGTWQIVFSNSVQGQRDTALDCSLSAQRYVATRMKQAYQPEGS